MKLKRRKRAVLDLPSKSLDLKTQSQNHQPKVQMTFTLKTMRDGAMTTLT